MFDRLGHKEDETPFIVEWFVSHGIAVWSVKEGEQRFDQHVDFLMNYIRFWQASGESKKTSIRTKTALEQLVAEGRFRGGIVPYGYKLEPSGILNKRKHEVMKLVIEENLRELFAAVKCGGISTVTDDTKKQLAEKQAELLELTQQFEESQSQYELFKDRLLDSIQQADPKRQSMLTEVLDEAYERVVSLRKGVGILQAQVEGLSETVAEPEKHAARIMEWANIFEVCSAETQKMIAGYMLKCVTVFQDYRMDIQTNDIGIAIPMLGTESTEQI